MLPFNAEHYYFITSVERRQLLAQIERERLVQQYGVATGALARWSSLSGRIRAGLGSVQDAFARLRGDRAIRVGDEVAARPSA